MLINQDLKLVWFKLIRWLVDLTYGCLHCIEWLKLFNIPDVWCFALIWAMMNVTHLSVMNVIYFIYDEFILFICESVNEDKRYRIMPLINITVFGLWWLMMLHYCVKPLDYTIHTQIWICTRKSVKSRIF